MTTPLRRAAVIAACALAVITVVAPASQAKPKGKPDLVWYFGTPERTVVDLGDNGPSVGDITVSSGDVSEVAGKDAIGYYTTSQTLVRANLPGGREIRDVDLSVAVPGGRIYATSLIKANAGAAPTQTQVFAIVGGTGMYDSVTGTLIHGGFTSQGSKATFYFG